jgi:hypothetical protein
VRPGMKAPPGSPAGRGFSFFADVSGTSPSDFVIDCVIGSAFAR